MRQFSARWYSAVAVMGLSCAFGTTARADDAPDPDEPSPVGTWKWSFEREGKMTELALKIKDDDQDDDEVTGTFVGQDRKESPIKDGKFKDGELSFVIIREFKGRVFTIKYEGLLVEDRIRGTTEVDVLGETRYRDWEAKRVAGSRGELNGAWTFVLESPLGRVERTIKIKQDGEKLTGTCSHEQGEAELKDGKLKGADFSFVVAYERDGKPTRFAYQGKLQGRSLKGAVAYELGGDSGKLDSGKLDFTGERLKRGATKK